MTAVLIPPSPPSEEASNPAIITIKSIVSKIKRGNEEVNTADLQELETSLDDNPTVVPYLNRDFLKTCPANPLTIVRYVGMVQDMLNPEFYVSKVNGAYTKYRELYVNEDDIDAQSTMLAERQPLVIVPIPHCSKWFSNSIVPDTTKHNNAAAERGLKNIDNRKRLLGDVSDGMEIDYREDMKSVIRKLNDTNTGDNDGEIKGDNDWWPKGFMNSDVNQCPVLARCIMTESIMNKIVSS